jgi:hypothetical protein
MRLLFGLLLLPLSASLVWGAARALTAVAFGAQAAAPFLAGAGLVGAAWLADRHLADPAGPTRWLSRAARWLYVLGHEMTHALAAWAGGGKVFAIKVADTGGHVDLSQSSAFVALAPYCVPFHALLVVVLYRVLLWLRPQTSVQPLFLLLMGAALAFHAVMTWETLTQVRQPDLDAAGGTVFSVSLIAAANGLVLLGLLKFLFPESVGFASSVAAAGRQAWAVWAKGWSLAAPGARRALAAVQGRAS